MIYCTTISAQINVVPMPADVRLTGDSLALGKTFTFIFDKANNDVSRIIRQFEVENVARTSARKISSNAVSTPVKVVVNKKFKPEAYKLEVLKNQIRIEGNTDGIFYAFQTLSQLLADSQAKKNGILAGMVVNDAPRFAYRGMHLDVGRHFFPVAVVKKYIDYLSFHKLNTFHWHLTEDQGWRIEIKKYPLLTSVGSCRAQTLVGRFGSDTYDGKKYCGFYTQQEIRDVVKYASDRFINIIPEVDMPGHSLAALAAYPYLGCTKGPYKVMETWGIQDDIMCAGNDSTFSFVANMLDEVMALFPSKYIHIGGDEAPKERWKTCPKCQNRIRTEKLKDEHELQSYFIQRIEKHVNSKNRQIIGWDEILEGGLAPNATVMSWRGTAGGVAAARLKHNAIMTPETPLYLNHSQTKNEDSITQGHYNPLELVYAYEPVPNEPGVDSSYILGAQGNMWSEYISNISKLEYMLFPRMSALSEVVWSPKAKRNWPDFERRLPTLFNLYRMWGANYSNAFYDIQPSVIPLNGGIGLKLESNAGGKKIIYVMGREQSASFDYTSPLPIKTSGEIGAALADKDDKIISSWAWQQFQLNKASGKKVTLTTMPNRSYSGSGAFTLVDGVQNKMGMSKSAQFLGFLGTDLEAVVDLDSSRSISNIILHAFEQTASWIYRPSSVSFFFSVDGSNFQLLQKDVVASGSKNLIYKVDAPVRARYIKIRAGSPGIIAQGKPGAGNKAWLFADEIEIN